MLVLTNLNKFVVIGFGIVFLGESDSWQAILGCITALGGGVWYAQERAALNRRRRRRRPPPPKALEGPPRQSTRANVPCLQLWQVLVSRNTRSCFESPR